MYDIAFVMAVLIMMAGTAYSCTATALSGILQRKGVRVTVTTAREDLSALFLYRGAEL